MSRRLVRALGLVGLLAASGCAGLPGLSGGWGGGGPEPLHAEVRPDAPAEYDVLVAQQHEVAGRLSEALDAYQRAASKDPDSAFLRRKLAEALARANRLDEALEHAERAFELDPDDVPTRLFLGQVYRMRRDTPAAEAVLLDADAEPFDDAAGQLLYQIYLETERLEDALALAEWMMQRDPGSLRGQVALARAYERLERPFDAEQVLRRALESDPENLYLYSLLARSLRARGEHAREVALYHKVLELHPRHHATLIALAEAQINADDLDAAITSFEEIERHYPEDLRSVVRLGLLQFEARRWHQAILRFEAFLEQNPEEYEVLFFLGSARRRAGDDDGAVEIFERIPESHKNYADARTELAAMFERRGEYAAALSEVNRAAKASPSRALDLYAATLRAKSGDFDGAVAHLEGLLNDRPQDDELLYNLGVVYGEAKRFDESIRYMRRALETNPDNASALNYVGYTWAERGINLDEAESMIRRALELRPEDGYITDSLGWVHYMRARPLVESGRSAEARVHLERALEQVRRAEELTGGDPVVSEHLGDIYLLQGDKQRALEMFEEAERLEPRIGEQPKLFEKLEQLRRELR